MINLKILFIVISVMAGVFTPAITYSQNNRLSIQTGLFHYFFDRTPVLNTSYLRKGIKPFNGLFYNSIDIQYMRKIDSISSISIDIGGYSESYMKIFDQRIKNSIYRRMYGNMSIVYERRKFINSALSFTYGGGVNLRIGDEAIMVGYGYLYGSDVIEFNLEGRLIADLGFNIRSGIEYTPLKWLTIFTKFDLITFFYHNDYKQIKRVRKFYNIKNYPNILDLSWQFGIGFNFGK